jgi:hypothetical protein
MAPTIATTAPAIIPIASKVRLTKPRLSFVPQAMLSPVISDPAPLLAP